MTMTRLGITIRSISGILFLAGAARADMAPVFTLYNEQQVSSRVYVQAEIGHNSLSGPYDIPIIVDLDLGTVRFVREAGADIGQPVQLQPSIDLTGGLSSVGLCVYALMGLGLCSAPHWIRRLTFAHIPEWYHDGGPFQIGHSFAVSPESLCPVPAYCFIQPDGSAEEFIPQYRLRTIVSSWWKSQFTPAVLASRGPPHSS
ncbi:MAG: hypothetical protein A2Z25_21160 [Planctomycetes bacterium RBG_16_55_9]|nr:MAG: hypothetical protein A2Z25_21160 [Planctomycetes bacterium RBG_16_55_9]